jgi:hypothetical protein
MTVRLGFWRRSWKVIRALFDFIMTYAFFMLVFFLSACLLIGFLQIFNDEMISKTPEFAKYLTTLAFSLAGFTFLGSALIKRKEDKVTQTEMDILNCSYGFILAGFFGLLFIGLNYLQQYSIFGKPVQYYLFIKSIIFPMSIIMSLILFLGSLTWLMITLRLKIPRLHKNYIEQNPKKSWKEFFKELIGFD